MGATFAIAATFAAVPLWTPHAARHFHSQAYEQAERALSQLPAEAQARLPAFRWGTLHWRTALAGWLPFRSIGTHAMPLEFPLNKFAGDDCLLHVEKSSEAESALPDRDMDTLLRALHEIAHCHTLARAIRKEPEEVGSDPDRHEMLEEHWADSFALSQLRDLLDPKEFRSTALRLWLFREKATRTHGTDAHATGETVALHIAPRTSERPTGNAEGGWEAEAMAAARTGIRAELARPRYEAEMFGPWGEVCLLREAAARFGPWVEQADTGASNRERALLDLAFGGLNGAAECMPPITVAAFDTAGPKSLSLRHQMQTKVQSTEATK